jgi:1-aminocyclopropane-1-carboxylate deaminase/D-cysteine desulfhydrase-like pyridoxal-dependent ACC family enzyme
MISLAPLSHYDQATRFSLPGKPVMELTVRRFDMLHPEISGNKWFKLIHWLKDLPNNEAVVSFGGAYSNHLLALSAAGKESGIRTIGIVRGDIVENPWLQAMQQNGMEIHFVSRESYRQKTDQGFLQNWTERLGSCRIVPEGGAGLPGILGAAEMVHSDEPFDLIVLPGGTGTSAAGIAQKLKGSFSNVLCFQVLKGEQILQQELGRQGFDSSLFPNLEFNADFHFGGYAKLKPELIEFQQKWMEQTGIPIDLVYGAKALFGLYALYQEQKLGNKTRIVYIHTGGLGPK